MSNTTTIKLIFGDKMRRLRLNRSSDFYKKFGNLLTTIYDSFPSLANSTIKVFYLDDEGDKIIILNDDDFQESVITMKEDLKMKILKFHIEISADTTSYTPTLSTTTPTCVIEDFVDGKFETAKYSTTTAPATAPATTTTPAHTTNSATSPPSANPEATTTSSSDNTSCGDQLETLLGLFNLEILAPFAHEWLNALDASGDEKAVYIVSLLKNPEFTDAIANARFGDVGTKIFETIEKELHNGVPPMITLIRFIKDESIKKLVEPIFKKFPDILKHFPMLNHIVDPKVYDSTSRYGCFGIFGNLPGFSMPSMMPFMSMMGMDIFPPHWKVNTNCHLNKDHKTSSESSIPTSTASKPNNSVPDAATREILRNEQAIEAAIAASLESFVDNDQNNPTMNSCLGEEESKLNELVESTENNTCFTNTSVHSTHIDKTSTTASNDSSSLSEKKVNTVVETEEEDGFVSLPSMEEKFSKELDILNSMGFYDMNRNIELLQEKDGNLRAVVEYYFM